MRNLILAALAVAVTVQFPTVSHAERKPRQSVITRAIADVCPQSKIRQIGSQFFYKNNKPIRASSAINAPVIGQNPVITLAGQPGGPRIFGGSGIVFSTNGVRLASMIPYPCRSDHCSGRVVGPNTSSVRRAAVRASGQAAGYVKVGGICVYIPDLGRCYGAGVNMGRPLCDRTVK